MFLNYNNLARSLKLGCLWTVVLQALSLIVGGFAFTEGRLCALCLLVGWLPILAIALRRPDHPTLFDVGIIFAGFPVIFVAIMLLDRLYFHAP